MKFNTFDASYVMRLQAGDKATVEHFIQYFSRFIMMKLRSSLWNSDFAEDIRQETFSRVFHILRSERGVKRPERLGPLVNSVCNHVLFEHYRSSSRCVPLLDEEAANLVGGAPDALTGMISSETGESIRAVLNSLGERDRYLLHALYFEERDKEELCNELGVTRNYVRVLVYRAKVSFREAVRSLGHQRMLVPFPSLEDTNEAPW